MVLWSFLSCGFYTVNLLIDRSIDWLIDWLIDNRLYKWTFFLTYLLICRTCGLSYVFNKDMMIVTILFFRMLCEDIYRLFIEFYYLAYIAVIAVCLPLVKDDDDNDLTRILYHIRRPSWAKNYITDAAAQWRRQNFAPGARARGAGFRSSWWQSHPEMKAIWR